jgi:PAS domain S-box-containing protein
MLGILEPFGPSGFMPHGHCYLWQTDLIVLHVVSDALIALSYLSIPLTLGYFVRRRRDLPFAKVFWAFAAFIVTCGMTHVMEIWTLWTPLYWLSGWVKALTALASIATALMLFALIPRALALPSPAQLRDALDALKRVEDRLRAATDGMIEGFLILESVRSNDGAIVDFRVVEANPAILERLQLTRPQAIGASLSTLTSIAPPGFERFVQVAQSRQRADEELSVLGAGEARPRWLQRQVVPLADGVAITSRDITDRKRAEDDLSRLAFIVECTHDAIIGQSPTGIIETWNAGAERLHGYTAAEALGRSVSLVVPPERADEDRQLLETIQRGERVHVLDTIRVRKDGTLCEVSLTASPIRNRAGELIGISTIARDISEKKRSERLANAEVLLKEVHHRVKNNLQMVSSLLKLHAEKVTDPLAKAAFTDSQERVRSIALLHERLHQSKAPGDVDVGDYAQSLIPMLLRSYAGGAASARVEAHGIVLPVDAAVPFGLILNELVANAVKHAFSGIDVAAPHIEVLLEKDAHDFVLTVRDNGKGFPADFDLARTTRMGMHIVKTLARQLGGALELSSPAGAECRLRFPNPSERDPS